MFVTEVIAFFIYLFLIRYIPSAAAVPITVERKAEERARIRVFFKAVKVSGDVLGLKSSIYHLSEKPSKIAVLFVALKEKRIRVIIGI